jgi:hypothetical protein
MAPGLWISVVALLAGYFVCPLGSLVGTNILETDRNSNSVTSANHSNNNSEKLGASADWNTMTRVVANDSSDREAKHHGIHIANWRWDEIGVFFTFAVFIIVSGLAKVGKLLGIYCIYYGGTVLVCAYSVSIVFGTVDHFKQLMYLNFHVLNILLFLFLLSISSCKQHLRTHSRVVVSHHYI